jgi:hypothetical protein
MAVTDTTFTHFGSSGAELPAEYYSEIGRALYRWSQLEGAVCTLATSIMPMPWLDAMDRLRSRNGFKVKNIFEQLIAAAQKKNDSELAVQNLKRAQALYEARKVFFHSVWGHVSGSAATVVGIQEWTSESYDNFKHVPLKEIAEFASECAATFESLMKTIIPLFHGSESVTVNDDDGLPRGLEKPEGAHGSRASGIDEKS